jgi:dihydrofolate reductase
MISLIVAMSRNRVIGKQGELPWHLPEDLQHFKKITEGHTVIMGRKTYESIPAKYRPLPHRVNIVISRTMGVQDSITVVRSVEDAIRKGKERGKDVFIIGGGTIYQQALPFVETMYISFVDKEIEGDTYFPAYDESAWETIHRKSFKKFTLHTLTRKQE